MGIELHCGDCLEIMKTIKDKSIDMILCDLPYGVTACKWDTIIPFELLWEQYNRIIKDNGAIVLFGSEPFATIQRMSNIKMYRYDWVWDKERGSNFQSARIMPMKCHEVVSVFYKKKPTYNPQWWYSTPYSQKARKRRKAIEGVSGSVSEYNPGTISEDGKRYPISILRCKRDSSRLHPTQKPVSLLEYLIKTYTNDGEVVLDNCMGSGSTGVACVNTGRNFIGIEKDETYFNIATKRIEEAVAA